MNAAFGLVETLIGEGKVSAAATLGYGCAAEALFKMSVGNSTGVKLSDEVEADDLFSLAYGSFIVELADDAEIPANTDLVTVSELGCTTEAYEFAACGEVINMAKRRKLGRAASSPYSRIAAKAKRLSRLAGRKSFLWFAANRSRSRALSSRYSLAPTANTIPLTPLSALVPNLRSW